MSYLPRIVEMELDECLAGAGAVVLEGPKSCGKTATARQRAASEVLLDTDHNARQLASVDPATALAGATPRLIDEWQLEPSIWNHVRRAVDDRADPGQFILTGSAVPTDDVTRHSGAGRFARIRMRPLSLFESGHSSGEMSLADLLNRSPPERRSILAQHPGACPTRSHRGLAGQPWPEDARGPAIEPGLSERDTPHRRLPSRRETCRPNPCRATSAAHSPVTPRRRWRSPSWPPTRAPARSP